MTTYRERRERKAQRLREWAEKREARAKQASDQAHGIADVIPLGQPILVGHHSERRHRRDLSRIDRAMGAMVEHARTAERFERRADTIDAQLDRSIYSDDSDALERLAERIADLEAQRDRIKAYNTSCRRKNPDTSVLTEGQRREISDLARYGMLRPDRSFPPYVLSNLSANIKRNRDRLTEIQARQQRTQEAEGSASGVVIERSGGGVRVTFAEKPERSVLDALKAAGFRWHRGSWIGAADKLPPEIEELT